MADILATAAAWLSAQLKAQAGRVVTYARATASVEITATLGRKLLKLSDEAGGTRIETAERDYVFTAADLVLWGGQTEPAKGDRIEDANDPDGVTRTWEVLSPGAGEQAWNWCDPFRRMVRVHTKLVGD